MQWTGIILHLLHSFTFFSRSFPLHTHSVLLSSHIRRSLSLSTLMCFSHSARSQPTRLSVLFINYSFNCQSLVLTSMALKLCHSAAQASPVGKLPASWQLSSASTWLLFNIAHISAARRGVECVGWARELVGSGLGNCLTFIWSTHHPSHTLSNPPLEAIFTSYAQQSGALSLGHATLFK